MWGSIDCRIPNPEVVGSNPAGRTSFFEYSEFYQESPRKLWRYIC